MTDLYIIDDHKVFIEGISMMLGKIDWLHTVQGFTEPKEFYDKIVNVECKRKRVLLLDVNLNRVVNGIDICKEVKQKAPDISIIALTLHHERRFVHGMIKAGCDAYLLKSSSFEEIAKAIFAVSEGRQYFTEEIIISLKKENELKDVLLNLNPREKRDLEAVVKGTMNTDIAEALQVSVKTVEYYRRGLFIKFGVSNAVELVNEVNKNELLL